jgi:hypothetical protein
MKKLLLSLLLISFLSVNSQVILPNEGFEGTVFPPAGWTTTETNATNNWTSSTSANFLISGNNSALVQWIAGDQDEWLISPTFSLAGQTSAFLNFSAIIGYAFMVAPDPNGDLNVKISTDDGLTWTDIWSEEDLGVYTDYDLQTVSLDLSAYLGNANCKVAFQYSANDADSVSIDNISVTGCPTIKNLELTALTDTTVTFTWEDLQDSYDIDWGLVGLAQGAGTITNQTESTFSPAGVVAGTGYRLYLRSNCGTRTGAWEGPFNVYTTLSTPTNAPYSYGFEQATFGTAGWTSPATTTGGVWGLSAGTGALVQDGTQLAFCTSSTSAATSDYLFSRGINMQAGEQITINYYIRKFNSAGTTAVVNLRSKIGNAATVAAATTTLLTHAAFNSLTYQQQTTTYTAPAAGVYYIGFECYSPQHTAAQRAFILLDAFNVTTNLSNDSFLAANLSVYPNPTSSVVNISNTLNAVVNTVEIADLNGRVVKTLNVNNTEAQISISDLAAGVYMLKVSTDQGTATKKIVKQ